ncbi:CocE/NonD family hydrolase [Amycolatopsis sp. NPDC023774]|uniref:CocE/NonD family hydrolase n=1 Tax=Amycolatopsis sp. NPDC023774 TaxID=3155015 RepID=UPI0033C1C021
MRGWQRDTAPATLETYPQHPLYDDYWRERSVRVRWDRLDVPLLDVGGWLDQYRNAMVQTSAPAPRTSGWSWARGAVECSAASSRTSRPRRPAVPKAAPRREAVLPFREGLLPGTRARVPRNGGSHRGSTA